MTNPLAPALRERSVDEAGANPGARVRVLFLCNVLTGGGAERFVSNALQFLDRRSFDPALALFRDEVVYPLPPDVPVHLLHKTKKWDIPGAIWRLKKLLDRLEPDVLVTPHTGIGFFASEAVALARRPPFWLSRIANDPDSEDKGVYGAWVARSLRRADAYVANSLGLKGAFERRYPFARGRTQCLYNAADFHGIGRRAAEPPALGFRRRPALVSVGRLHRQKRYDVLLRAFRQVRDGFDAELAIIGEGPLRGDLQRLAASLGLAEHVQMPGFLENPYAIMASADLFVLSSDFEGLPNVLIEAQGLGLATVSTDCPHGPSEIIAHRETGLLTRTGDVDELAAAIRRLLGDPEERGRLAARGREFAHRRFAAPQIQAELERILAKAGRGWDSGHPRAPR